MSGKTKRRSALVLVMFLCAAALLYAEDAPPVVAVVPLTATGVTQEEAETFAARLAETFAAGFSATVADSKAVGSLLERYGGAKFEVLEVEQSLAFAAEVGADILIGGTIGCFLETFTAFITVLNVNPAVISVIIREGDCMDALMATVPGLYAEFLEYVAARSE